MPIRILAFGGGTNSTAIICGWIERGLKPFDEILFADTGAEKPHTYEHIKEMNVFLGKHEYPSITVLRRTHRDQTTFTLEDHCLEYHVLPSLAYGFKGCSQKFKIQPQDKYCNQHYKQFFKSGQKIEKIIGYDFAEQRRWMKARQEDRKYIYRFPLVEWEWDRAECVQAIQRAWIKQPKKSACYFCPASTKPDIDELKNNNPDLYRRAIALEDNAKATLKTCKGLGRRFSWRDYAGFPDNEIEACGYCTDWS